MEAFKTRVRLKKLKVTRVEVKCQVCADTGFILDTPDQWKGGKPTGIPCPRCRCKSKPRK